MNLYLLVHGDEVKAVCTALHHANPLATILGYAVKEIKDVDPLHFDEFITKVTTTNESNQGSKRSRKEA